MVENDADELTSEVDLHRLKGWVGTVGPEIDADPALSARMGFWRTAIETLDREVEEGRMTGAQRDEALALIITAKERNEELDGLTGLYNKRGILRKALTEVYRARRAPEPLPLTAVFMDLDRFKVINDTYGHPAGDAVLKEWATYLKETLRKTDILGRFGGEELVALLPGSDEDQAVVALDRIRINMPIVLGKALDRLGIDHLITMSVGVAQLEPGDTPEVLIARADARLYEAKAAGRNTVIGRRRPELKAIE